MTTPTPPGPATPVLVAALPSVSAPADDPELIEVVDAVNAHLRRFLVPGGDGEWSDDHVFGAVLLAGQLYRRRGSSGIEFSQAGDPVYLQRNHPDIARLLQIGHWTPPRVG
jgi:hypothetical protein